MTRTVGNGLKIPAGAVLGYALTSDASGNAAWAVGGGGGASGGTPPFVQTIGDGTSTTFTVTHGLGTRDVLVAVRETNSPYERILVSTTTPTTNTVFLDFTGSVPPATNEFTVIVTLADGGAVPEVTSLPGSPYDGQIVDLLADSAGSYGGPFLWRCKYRAATAGSYKWHVTGGEALTHFISTGQARASSTFGDLTTVGPTITVPFAGIYVPLVSVYTSVTVAGAYGLTDVQNGATAADQLESNTFQSVAGGAAGAGASNTREQGAITVAAAATVVKMVYRGDNVNNATFYDRRLSLRPVRLA